MLRDAEVKVDVGRMVGGSFVRVTHIPTGRQRMVGPIGSEPSASVATRLRVEIEAELRAAGLADQLEPGDLGAVVSAIAALWEKGCPVASQPEVIAPIAIRRWNSSTRRGVAPDDAPGRVRDLARGLVQHFEEDPKLVGPLKRDYECLAEVIDAVLRRP
jgi:hypothetical protein